MQRTLKGEFKVLEIVQRETIEAVPSRGPAPKLNLGVFSSASPGGAQMNFLGSADQHRFWKGKENAWDPCEDGVIRPRQ